MDKVDLSKVLLPIAIIFGMIYREKIQKIMRFNLSVFSKKEQVSISSEVQRKRLLKIILIGFVSCFLVTVGAIVWASMSSNNTLALDGKYKLENSVGFVETHLEINQNIFYKKEVDKGGCRVWQKWQVLFNDEQSFTVVSSIFTKYEVYDKQLKKCVENNDQKTILSGRGVNVKLNISFTEDKRLLIHTNDNLMYERYLKIN